MDERMTQPLANRHSIDEIEKRPKLLRTGTSALDENDDSLRFWVGLRNGLLIAILLWTLILWALWAIFGW
jgi:hypothetical protein